MKFKLWKKFNSHNKYFILINLLIFILISGLTFYIAYNLAQSERFGDETAHMIGGHLMLKGRRLYTNMQFNHQPLNYYFSAVVELLTRPNNLYKYISRQRLAISIYAIIWNGVYLSLFGPIILVFSAVFETIKFNLSGYKLLGETLAVYPLVTIIIITIKALVSEKKLTKKELIIYSISSFMIVFTLIPIAIVVMVSSLIVLYYYHKKSHIKYLFLPSIILTLFLFTNISMMDYVRESIIYNFKYFLPHSGIDLPSPLLLMFMPLYSFIPPFNSFKIFISVFIIFYLITGWFCYKNKIFKAWFLLLVLLVLSNFFRSFEPTLTNFHLLPYIGVFFIVEIYFSFYLFRKDKKYSRLFYLKNIITILLVLFNIAVSNNHYLQKRDRQTEFYINYSDSQSYGMAIEIIKKDNDELIALPNDPLINYVADIDIGSRMVEYYPWTYYVPRYRQEVEYTFKRNLPTFIVTKNHHHFDIPFPELEVIISERLT